MGSLFVYKANSEPGEYGFYQDALNRFNNNPADGLKRYGPLDTWDISSLTSLAYAFSSGKTWYFDQYNQDITGWDVSHITDMEGMFYGWDTNFNQDISGWDVSSVTNMSGMFEDNQHFNQDISGWSKFCNR